MKKKPWHHEFKTGNCNPFFFFFLNYKNLFSSKWIVYWYVFYCFDFSHAKVIQSPGRLLLYQRITIILWFTFHGCQVCLWCKSLCCVAILFLLFFLCCNFLAGKFRQLRFLMIVYLQFFRQKIPAWNFKDGKFWRSQQTNSLFIGLARKHIFISRDYPGCALFVCLLVFLLLHVWWSSSSSLCIHLFIHSLVYFWHIYSLNIYLLIVGGPWHGFACKSTGWPYTRLLH